MTSDAPVTTRVGGGVSPRGAGIVIAAALALVVAVAFVNRPPAPKPTSLAVVAPTAQPTAASSSAAPAASPTATPLVPRFYHSIEFIQDEFAAISMIGGRQFRVLLFDPGDGTLTGWTRVPYPRGGTEATMQLVQLWSRATDMNFQTLGSWTLPLDLLMPEVRQTGTVLTVAQPPSPDGANRLDRVGFQMAVRLESRTDYGVIWVTIKPTAASVDQHKIYGEDGIFGLPGWPWRADDAQISSPRVIKWLGRAWPGPGQKLTR